MKSIGKTLTALLIVITTLGGNAAMGALTTDLDRDRVALGDTLQLTLTATDGEDVSAIDLRPLLEDFEILQRSSSSNTSIINGHLSHTKQLIIELTPRRSGNLQIPAMQVDQHTTQSLPVVVTAAPDISSGGQPVLFEAEVDSDSVYVQGQLILTLRLQQSVNLEARSISELTLDNAFVKPLEQQSFQRTIDGRQWLVHEIRYAVFPEQSGTLEIPSQVFSGRAIQGQRSFFSHGGGQLLRRSTQPIAIDVLPRPASYTAPTWLPTRKLSLEEDWSAPPEQLRVGESATRTIRILGEGLQGAQLPPILFPATDGLKYYPDQPQISEREIASGLMGIREDSAAVVPTRAGTFLIPEVRIPWWDIESEQIRYAVLPERKITVAAPVAPDETPTVAPTVIKTSPADTANDPAPAPVPTPAPRKGLRIWQFLGIFSTLGWIITGLYLWRRQRPHKPIKPAAQQDNESEKQCFRRLLSACAANDAAGARSAMISWSAALTGQDTAVSLEQVAGQFSGEELQRELGILDARLYSPNGGDWSGVGLADCARKLRAEYRKGKPEGNGELHLYPRA